MLSAEREVGHRPVRIRLHQRKGPHRKRANRSDLDRDSEESAALLRKGAESAEMFDDGNVMGKEE